MRLGPWCPGWGWLGPDLDCANPCVIAPEPVCEDEDEDEDEEDYHNEGYL